ncbi:TetR/AcrR family transcriptional regulator [Nocardioides dubius]|uniref:TetR family transcriptional regulator n=2 Tax=Nocardioides dubius TaxID=317019 RepID=A0ABN1U2L4_9ACTN
MLDAAEEIAVEVGLGAITLTAVQRRAGQSNKSAAAYHFGSLDGLLAAVVARRMEPINAARAAHLERLAPDAGVAALVDALVRPFADATLRAPGSRYARFLAQIQLHPVYGPTTMGLSEASSLREVQQRITALLPSSPELVLARFAAAASLMIDTLARWEGQGPPGEDVDLLCADLTAVCTAVLSTPSPMNGEAR